MTSKESSPHRHRRQHRHKSYVHLPFAYRVRRKTFYRFVFGSAACLSLLCLIPYGIYRFTEGADRGTAAIDITPPAPVVTVPRKEATLVESKPALVSPDQTDLVRKTLADATLAMVCSYDGKQASIEIQSGSVGEPVTQPLEDAIYQKAIELEGAFLSLADYGIIQQSPFYEWQADQRYNGKPCWTIVSKLPRATQITHLIDQETGFEQVRYLNLMIDGTKYQLSIHFSDFREDQGLSLPHAYILKVNGSIRGQAQIDSIVSNSGLMPWKF